MTGRDFFIMEAIMNQNNVRQALIVFILLLVTLACALPAQTTSTPVKNPSSVETSLASTARALAQQTETAQGFTPTPSVVPTKTLTPTPKVSSSGTSLETLADGSTRFTDHTAGFRVVFPAGWLAIRVGEPEYYQAWDKEAAKNPVFQDIFASMQNTDPNQFRVTAIDIRSAVTYQTFSRMDVVFAPNDIRPLNEVRIVQTNRKLPFSKFRLLSSSLAKTPDGLEVAIIEFQWESASPENIIFLTYHREVLFKVASGTASLQFTTGLSEKDKVLPEFEKVIGSVDSLTP
jgi:hypothetical protein